jgi:hypothetical protein
MAGEKFKKALVIPDRKRASERCTCHPILDEHSLKARTTTRFLSLRN